MSRRIAEQIVHYLGLRHENLSSREFPQGSAREWRGALGWLDRSGLALYFWQRLRTDHALGRVPSEVAAELEQRRHENEMRVDAMRDTFAAVNRGFEAANVRYAVLKGFSLVPEYCPEASLRAQADLDYLIGGESLERAQRVLSDQGYSLKKRNGDEFCYWMPSEVPTTCRQQYSPKTQWTVELHLSVWEQRYLPMRGVVAEDFFESVTLQEWNGVRFPCLAPPEMFLAQVLHAFKHVLDGWIQLSWLLEIGTFISRHRESTVWAELVPWVEREPLIAEAIGIVCQTAADVFEVPLPPLIEQWSRQVLPAARLWLQRYSREFMFEKLPRVEASLFSPAKLVFFLKEQYIADPQIRRDLQGRLLLPWRRLRRLGERSPNPRITAREEAVRKIRWLAFIVLYHLGANCRYFWELLRWRRITTRISSKVVEPAGDDPACSPRISRAKPIGTR